MTSQDNPTRDKSKKFLMETIQYLKEMSIAWGWARRTIRALTMIARRWAVHDVMMHPLTSGGSQYIGEGTELPSGASNGQQSAADSNFCEPWVADSNFGNFIEEWTAMERDLLNSNMVLTDGENVDMSQFLVNMD